MIVNLHSVTHNDVCHVGTVRVPEVNDKPIYTIDPCFVNKRSPTGNPIHVMDALDDLYKEFSENNPEPDSDSEFADWLVSDKGWMDTEITVTYVING